MQKNNLWIGLALSASPLLISISRCRFSSVILLSIAILLSIQAIKDKINYKNLISPPIAKNAIAGLFGIFILSAIASSSPMHAFSQAARFAIFSISFFIFINQSRSYKINTKILKSSIILSLASLLLYGFKFYNLPGRTLNILPILILMYFYISRSKKDKIISALLYIYSLYLILNANNTTSKVAIILMPIIFVSFLYLPRKFVRYSLYIKLVTIPIAFLFFIAISTPDKIVARLPNLEPSFIHRLCIWKNDINEFAKHPHLGVGFDESRIIEGKSNGHCMTISQERMLKFFAKYGQNKASELHLLYSSAMHPHNIYIEMLFHSGIIALILFVILTIKIVVHLDKTSRTKSEYASVMTFFILILIPFLFALSISDSAIVPAIFILSAIMVKLFHEKQI